MTSPDNATIIAAIDKAEKSQVFTTDEFKALKDVAYIYIGFQAFGRFATFFKTVIVYLGWFAGVIVAGKFGIDFFGGGK